MTEVYVLLAIVGEGVEKSPGLGWTSQGGAGSFTQASCRVTLRRSSGKTPSATIWQDLVTRAQCRQLSTTLEAEAGSWPKSLFLLEEIGGHGTESVVMALSLCNMGPGREDGGQGE